ncbi:MAG: hypothetical protein AAGH40_08930 [Verrucomicrobiota bacterium]
MTLLTCWAGAKWNQVWVERSNGFFPPEIQQTNDIEELAWRYPIYRSNDTYQWVHLADSLAEGNADILKYRTDEGPAEGRPNAWHSGLARMLHLGGKINAAFRDWPVERGIHDLAHWMGPALLIAYITIGAILIQSLASTKAAAIFMLLAFFAPALRWDFDFSRIDHESIFQCGCLIQLIGLFGILSGRDSRHLKWPLLAAFGSALCWWVSATMQSAISLLIVLSSAINYGLIKRGTPETNQHPERSLIIWGLVTALIAGVLLIFDQRKPTISISSLHPIHLIAQLGAGFFCAACCSQRAKNKKLMCLLGAFLGSLPLLWIALHGEAAHTWLSPFMRRMHDHIVEFQSSLGNGLWKQWANLSTLLIILVTTIALNMQDRKHRFLYVIALGLFALALYQNRWLGLCTSASMIALVLGDLGKFRSYLTVVLVPILALPWLQQWIQIEEKPGRLFVADMILQVGARDINLNLSALTEANSKSIVAMPFAFAATSALFDKVHPLGTFYWENEKGLMLASGYFSNDHSNEISSQSARGKIDFVVVQANRFGRPFAELTTWASLKDHSDKIVDQSRAWQLANRVYPDEEYGEVSFWGTFSEDKFEALIYKFGTTTKKPAEFGGLVD